MLRIGHGYDVHAFGGVKPLVLGGVRINDCTGLVAHSDGDVVLHAVCDALLGAAALGDIGKHFPDSDPQFAGADSRMLLKKVNRLLVEKDFCINNLDITVVAQVPKLAPHILSMCQTIAEDLSVSIDQVNVKATTTEGLGYIGRKEGIAVHAVVIIQALNQ